MERIKKTRTIQTTIYKFSELSDKAKEKARKWYIEASIGDNYFAECVIEDAKEIGALFGLEIENIYWSGFGFQGDGACITGRYAYKTRGLKAIKDYAPKDERLHAIVELFQELQKAHFYRVSATIHHRGMYYHEYSMIVDTDYPSEVEKELLECLAYFSKWIYRNIESEYEYRNSDEAVDEAIQASDYEFTEDGKRA